MLPYLKIFPNSKKRENHNFTEKKQSSNTNIRTSQTLELSEKDFKDAQEILNWNKNSASLVSGNNVRERMNEYKTHINWAQRIIYLAESFGVAK